jgi:hypothetical protein
MRDSHYSVSITRSPGAFGFSPSDHQSNHLRWRPSLPRSPLTLPRAVLATVHEPPRPCHNFPRPPPVSRAMFPSAPPPSLSLVTRHSIPPAHRGTLRPTRPSRLQCARIDDNPLGFTCSTALLRAAQETSPSSRASTWLRPVVSPEVQRHLLRGRHLRCSPGRLPCGPSAAGPDKTPTLPRSPGFVRSTNLRLEE